VTDANHPEGLAGDIAEALRTPFVPALVRDLQSTPSVLTLVWAQLAPSVGTAGFLGSALYMADMALDAVEEVYSEPQLDRAALLEGGLGEEELEHLVAVLDVFHWLHPQLLLLAAAVAEGFERGRVGGQGRADERAWSERDDAHLATEVRLAEPDRHPLPEIAEVIGLDAAPDVYRAAARWPRYLEPAWEELQHLSAYPDFRRRGRALYYYARSGARFLAAPLDLSAEALDAAGLAREDIEAFRAVIDRALPALATMMMHTCAMRVGLGIHDREVVQA
jgi:hypothetical protein